MRLRVALLAPLLLAACAGAPDATQAGCPGPDCPGCPGPDCQPAPKADIGYNELNLAAGTMVLYEVQVRTANACRTDLGTAWQRESCRQKPAPRITYRAEGLSCPELGDLDEIRLGTLDDMLEPTATYEEGITLGYIDEQVGANTVWLMPIFPNNDTWSIPSACDNLGSPYAVRDYLHARGTLARSCIEAGRDERSADPCWGNQALDDLIAEAHRRGMRVMLDVAFNHFGHNYTAYDLVDFRSVRDRLEAGEDLDRLWDFAATEDEALLHPEILDTPATLEAAAARDVRHQYDLDTLRARCPSLAGQPLVQAYNAWRMALDWERESFPCDTTCLEHLAPGFYLGADHWSPSQGASDSFSGDPSNPWRDVKFLFHQDTNRAHVREVARNREYLFRVLNYWVARGVDSFRLDHTTDYFSGLNPRIWDYIVSKVDYYAWRRGQARPVYLAEEFGDQQGMNRVVDIMTEGYVRDMCGRDGVIKDAHYVEGLIDNMKRFGDHAFVMTALETHDETRLMEGTGFDAWSGAGFWGIGTATRSTPMLLMGQERGETRPVAFRKSDLLRSRFDGAADASRMGDTVGRLYRTLIESRLDPANRALVAGSYQFLRTRDSGQADPRLLAMARWSGDGSVVFVLHNLWPQAVAQSYFIPPDLADQLWLRPERRYRLVDLISGEQQGACLSGADLAWSFHVALDAETRAQWLRLELCP